MTGHGSKVGSLNPGHVVAQGMQSFWEGLLCQKKPRGNHHSNHF